MQNVSGDSVLLAGPNSKASNVVSIDVSFDIHDSKFVLNTIDCNLVDIKDYTPDVDFLNTFRSENDEINEYFSQVICTFTDDMLASDAIFGNSSFVDFIHNIQLGVTEVSVSLSSLYLSANFFTLEGGFLVSSQPLVISLDVYQKGPPLT